MRGTTTPTAVQKTLSNTHEQANAVWDYFNKRDSEPEEGTFALMVPKPPASLFARILSAIPGAFLRAGTEGVYNADQIVFTPIRTWAFIAAGIAAVAAGTAAALSVTALNTLPVLGPLVLIPAILFVLASLVRAIHVKPKDIVSQFRKLYPDTKTLAKFELPVGNGASSEATLFAATVRTIKKEGEAKYFLSAYYELSHDGNQKAFISNFNLTKEQYDTYIASDEASKKTQVTTWLIRKAGIDALNQQAAAEQEADRVARSKGRFAYLRFRIQHLWNKHYKGMSRFQIIRESLWVPFKFVFGGAMIYWSIWLCATVIPGSSAVIMDVFVPFGSSWIAFGIPLFAAIGLAVVRAIVTYQQQDIPKNYDETKNLAETLFQIAAAKKIANQQSEAAGITAEQRATFIAGLPKKPSHQAAASESNGLWHKLWYSLATLFMTDYSIRNMLNSSRRGSNLRITVNTLARFATGFILAFISLWPIVDFAIVHSGPGNILVLAQFGAALLSGLAFAVYAAYNKSVDEQKRLMKFAQLKEDSADELLALEDRLIADRTALKAVETTARQAFLNKVNARADQLATGLNPFMRIWKRSELLQQAAIAIENELDAGKAPEVKLQFKGLFTERRSVIAHDEWEFTGKFNLEEKTLTIKIWTLAKRFFDRFNEFVAAGGSGGLMVRLAFGAAGVFAGVGLVSSPLNFGTPIIIAIAVWGFVWGVTRLLRLLDSKNTRAADQFAARGPEAAKETMIAELEILQARRVRLTAATAALSANSVVTAAAAIPTASPASLAALAAGSADEAVAAVVAAQGQHHVTPNQKRGAEGHSASVAGGLFPAAVAATPAVGAAPESALTDRSLEGVGDTVSAAI